MLLIQIKEFFEAHEWVATAVQFVGYIVAGVLALWAAFKNSTFKRFGMRMLRWTTGIGESKYGHLVEFAQQSFGDYEQLMGKVKRGIKIAIVDDFPDDFPIEYLKEIGFRGVTIFSSIGLAQIDELRKFDVVFLDIADVLMEDPVNGGVQVLKRLTDPVRTPRPVVIAVSGQRFDIERGQFYKSAHDVVKKPIDKMRCESVLLDVIDPFKAAQHLDEIMNKTTLSHKHRSKVMWCLIEYMRGERSWEKTERELKKHQWQKLEKSKNYADSVKRWLK